MRRSDDLMVVWPYPAFAPPPVLGRPELRAAFQLGVEHSAAPGLVPPETALDPLDRELQLAYRAGLLDPLGPPTYLDGLPSAALYVLVARRRPFHPLMLVELALAVATATLEVRMRRRSARRLGLTKETAPVVEAPPLGAMLQAGLAIAHRIRAGRPRQPAATALATQVVRVFMRRRSWRRALRPRG